MKVVRRKPLNANVGVMSVGLDTYWEQFPGLLDEMNVKSSLLIKKLKNHQVTITDFGMVDNAEKAYSILPKIKESDLDVLFVDMVTYATSATFGAIVRDLQCPVVLVALQPLKAMDYPSGTTFIQLCNDDFCSVPEFTGVAERMGKPVADVIIGTLKDDPQADTQLAEWCRIAHVRHDLRKARFGHMGHVLEAMLDMQTDPTALTAAFGCHAVQCEPDEIMCEYSKLSTTDPEVKAMSKRILEFFDTPDPVSDPLTTKLTDPDLLTASQVGIALERFIAAKKLDGFAYYYEAAPESEMRKVVTNFIVCNSLLTASGFPMCGEFDIKTCVAMLIMDRLEIGGSFAEFHPVDFERDTVLLGHDGPHHLNIANGKPVIRSLKKYHGKPGSGAGVEFNIKTGPITMLSIGVKADGKFKFIIAEGESMEGKIPPTGNTNTHGKFRPDVRTFLKRWSMAGPTHHFALGVGHHADTIKKIADIFGIEGVIIR
ncbi:MAG: L-fucose/L-arabinose isomerase family protein [Victivallales bacterium]|jgi:L-arabinose isomerase|nr:L-fucose/L-arabinose isomerase family protein [Victivallales bacterium]